MSTSRGILAFGRFPKHRIEFNKVLSCSAVAPIQQKSLLVMLHRKTQLAQPTMSIADIVLDIGVAWVAQCGKLERRDGPTPIPYLPRWHRSANLPMEVSLPSLGQVLRATFQRSSATGIQRQRIAAGAISAPSSAAIMTERSLSFQRHRRPVRGGIRPPAAPQRYHLGAKNLLQAHRSACRYPTAARGLQGLRRSASPEYRLALLSKCTLRFLRIFAGSERNRLRLLEAISIPKWHFLSDIEGAFCRPDGKGTLGRDIARDAHCGVEKRVGRHAG